MHHKNERIALQGISGANDRIRLISTIIPEDTFCANSCNYIIKIDEKYDCSIKSLLGIFNSKLTNWVFRKSSTNSNVNCYEVNNLRLPKSNKIGFDLIDTIVSHILFTKNLIPQINSNIPNTHISEVFEEVIDALVFELYFPDEFAEKGIAIQKYAQDIFKPIEGLSEDEQIKAIQEAYETLREKKNPLRNQILLMQIELKELLNPILSL